MAINSINLIFKFNIFRNSIVIRTSNITYKNQKYFPSHTIPYILENKSTELRVNEENSYFRPNERIEKLKYGTINLRNFFLRNNIYPPSQECLLSAICTMHPAQMKNKGMWKAYISCSTVPATMSALRFTGKSGTECPKITNSIPNPFNKSNSICRVILLVTSIRERRIMTYLRADNNMQLPFVPDEGRMSFSS